MLGEMWVYKLGIEKCILALTPVLHHQSDQPIENPAETWISIRIFFVTESHGQPVERPIFVPSLAWPVLHERPEGLVDARVGTGQSAPSRGRGNRRKRRCIGDGVGGLPP